MLGDGRGVAARHGTGQCVVAVPQRVLQGGAEQRREHPVRRLDPRVLEQLGGLGDEGGQVVGGQGEPGVVERAVLLLHGDRLATHLQHEGLAERFELLDGGDREARVPEPVQVDRGPGERHRRVHGERENTEPSGRLEYADAVAPARVDHHLTRPEGADRGQAGDQPGKGLVGDGEQHEVGGTDDLGHVEQGYAGEQVGGPGQGRLAHGSHRHDPVTGPVESRAEDGADAPGTDDAHREPRRVLVAALPACLSTHGGEPTAPARQDVLVGGAMQGGADGQSRAHGGTASLTWRTAWQAALYGPAGFYRQSSGPAGHFTTAAHAGPGRILARALWAWADRVGAEGIVDLGAGRGELIRHLYAEAPDRPLAGLDVVAGPADLPEAVAWTVAPGGAVLPDLTAWRPATGPVSLVVANEWLDVVPCTIAEVDGVGALREVGVDTRTGAETLGSPVSGADLAWCERWWPGALGERASPGDRVEVGRSRDVAWAGLLDRLGGSPALAIDYGHLATSRPTEGSLTAYRSGRQVDPVPDGSCDLTAHVAVDSLPHARFVRQRVALDELGVTAAMPDHGLARSHPAAYLDGVADATAAITLRSLDGFGAFWWIASV